MNIVLDLGSGELTFQKKASSHGTRIEKVQKPRASGAGIPGLGCHFGDGHGQTVCEASDLVLVRAIL